jgi:hypothetical protein
MRPSRSPRTFLLERNPRPLHEGAEPAGMEHELVLLRMRGHCLCRDAGRVRVDVLVGHRHLGVGVGGEGAG